MAANLAWISALDALTSSEDAELVLPPIRPCRPLFSGPSSVSEELPVRELRANPGVDPDAEFDAKLMTALAAGDRSAIAPLYDRHAAAMLGVALRILRNRQDAEDLLHDVFVEAWQRAAGFDSRRGTVRTWLLVRVRSRGIDRIRALETARRAAMASAPPPDEPAAVTLPEWGEGDRARARTALLRLPAEQRALVELSYFEGLSHREMAERCGIPVGTVKSRLAAAIEKLRGHFSADEEAR